MASYAYVIHVLYGVSMGVYVPVKYKNIFNPLVCRSTACCTVPMILLRVKYPILYWKYRIWSLTLMACAELGSTKEKSPIVEKKPYVELSSTYGPFFGHFQTRVKCATIRVLSPNYFYLVAFYLTLPVPIFFDFIETEWDKLWWV